VGTIRPYDPNQKDGQPSAHQDQILELLGEIYGNPVGQIIVAGIIKAPRNLIIKPYTGTACRAQTRALQGRHSRPEGLTATGSGRNKSYRSRTVDEDSSFDAPVYDSFKDKDDPGPTTGRGSDAEMEFSKDTFVKSACSQGFYVSQAAEVLVHEMVHALRVMTGKFNPMQTSLRYVDEEEFLALQVSNVYHAVNHGNTSLAADYNSRHVLQDPFNTSKGFLRNDENREILEHYSKHWQPTFGLLGCVQAPFNPFAEFKAHSAKCGGASHSPAKKARK
jgi:hypothetical protein